MAGLAVAYSYFNRIQTLFFNGANVDLRKWGHLAYSVTAFNGDPSTYYAPLFAYFSNHLRPLLVLLCLPSSVLPINIVDNISLIFAAQAFIIVLSASLLVPALALPGPALLSRALASVLGLAFFMSAPNLAAISYPHFEALFAPLAILFFIASATGHRVAAALCCLLLLLVREDLGIHLFAIIALVVTYELTVNKTLWERLSFIAICGIISLGYSLIAGIIQHYFFPGGSDLIHDYLNNPIYSHVTIDFVLRRLQQFCELRGYLILAFFATALIGFYYREPAYLLGYVAFFPWLVFNLLAVKFEPGTLATYHGFPFILALIWPVVYEVLRGRLFGAVTQDASPVNHHGEVAEGLLSGLANRQTQIVLATILICFVTTLLEPRSMKALDWKPAKAEKRHATLVVMNFLAHDLHHELKLRVSPSIAAIGLNEIKKKDVVQRRQLLANGDDASGVIFHRGLNGADAVEFAKFNGFDRAVRLGSTNIFIAFRGSQRDEILGALQRTTSGRLRLVEGAFPEMLLASH